MVEAETDQAASFAYVENQMVLASVLQKNILSSAKVCWQMQ